MDSEMNCCGKLHAWDIYDVPNRWKPQRVRCLIVGENPGEQDSMYFYDVPANHDPVRVRTNLLYWLTVVGLISEPTLIAFRAGGFLFDHAIRCHMPFKEIKRISRTADRTEPLLPATPAYLRPLMEEALTVWVMGRIARKAVGVVAKDFPTVRDKISQPPYPCRLRGTKYFVSRYLSRISREHAAIIARELRRSFPEVFGGVVRPAIWN